MNDIQIFNNPDFGEIRTVMIEGEPWFVGVDVAKALGYKKPTDAVNTNVDEGDSTREGVWDKNNHRQNAIVINESGLYSLIFGSKLEKAKNFKRWVTSEVLPTLRKTGTYSMNKQLPMTTEQKIQLLAQGNVELKQEIDDVRKDLDALKMDLPILPIEADRITEAVRKRGVDVLGGKHSQAYGNRSLRQKVYNNLYANLKYNFGCRSYKAIKRSQTEKAIEIIERYNPPYFIMSEIENENAQKTLKF